MTSPRFHLVLLGEPHLRDQLNGSAIGLPAKAFELAAYLVLAGGGAPVRREAIAQLLWEDAERGRAAVNLRALLARIRRVGVRTGFELLTATREHLRLNAPTTTDIVRLQALASDDSSASVLEQCALYRGDLLDGAATTGEWLTSHRSALRNSFMAGAVRFLDRADPTADAAAIEFVAAKLLAVDPYQEAGYRALMRLHAAAGRLRELERVYRECCERFELELGEGPGSAVVGLYRSLCGLDSDVHEGGQREAPKPHAVAVQAVPPLRAAPGAMPSVCILLPPMQPGSKECLLIAALLEDVTIGLCAQRTFAVIAPYTAWQLGSEGPQEDFAAGFGIGYLLQTRLQKFAGERLLTPKLIDARSRRIIWADRFALDIDDLGPAYRRLLWRITRSLAEAIENAELDRHRSEPGASAYVAYLLGTRALAKVQLPDLRAARNLFRTSLRQDEGFAPAFGGIARTLIMEWLLLARGDTGLLEDAEQYARRAHALDPEHAEGLRELGLCSLYRGRFDESLQAFAEAEDRAPQHADLIADHADALSLSGLSWQALTKMGHATALNPLSPDRYRWYEGTILYQLDRYEDAIRAVSRMADSSPAFKLLAASWAMLGDRVKAHAYARKVLQTYPEFTVAEWMSMLPIRDAGLKERYEHGLRAAGFR